MTLTRDTLSVAAPRGGSSVTFDKGDRVQWCEGLNGVVIGPLWSGGLLVVKTDDGILRTAPSENLTGLPK